MLTETRCSPRSILAVLATVFVAIPVALAQGAVVNDDFVNAEILAPEGALSATNVDATKQPGEPNHAGKPGGASVWYQWTASTDGYLTVDTYGSDFDTTLAMYTGAAVDALTEIASNDDAITLQSQLKDVFVFGGTSYHIAVDGYAGAMGQVTLSWSFVEGTDIIPPIVTITTPRDGSSFYQGAAILADYTCTEEELGSGIASCVGDVPFGGPIDTDTLGPLAFTVTGIDNSGNIAVSVHSYTVDAFTNDDFAAAEVLADDRGNLLRANFGATKEPGEPDHAGNPGGASVWFQWTAPTDGFFTIDTFDTVLSDFDTTLAIYTGFSVDTLTEVASNDNALGSSQSQLVEVPVMAGTTYFIAVDGFDGATGRIDLDWLFFNGPTFTEITPQDDPLWVTDADHDFWLNAAAPADVDGDGDLDLAVIGFFVEYNVSAEDRLVIFLNEGPDLNGDWTFSQQDVPLGSLSAGSSDLAWGDFDGDGDPDLAVASEGETAIYRNDAGVLVRLTTDLPGYYEDSGYTGAYDLRSLTWADADNDGDLDLLLPSTFDFDTFSFGTALIRNDGSDGVDGWLFVDSGVLLDATVHAQTAWADNDGDGDLDLFMANIDNLTGDGFVRTYRNDGGVFVSEQPIGSLSIEYGLGDWGDYDQDGDLDIMVVGLIQETDGKFNTVLRIYDNEAGLYIPNTIIRSSFFPWLDLHAATWADYDSDGDIDLLVTGSVIGETDIEGKSEIYINDGGQFYPLGRDLPAPIGSLGRGGSFTWFDVDGDADLDYFVAGAYYVPGGNGLVEAQMHLYRNDAIDVNVAPDAPMGLSATVTEGNEVRLSWTAATDDQTASEALTYDLRVQSIGAQSSAIAVERQRLPEPGNISATTHWNLRGLPPGQYQWSVRAVDSAFNGGPASSGEFTVTASSSANVVVVVPGLSVRGATCVNRAKSQVVRIPVERGKRFWNCTAAGLAMDSGDPLTLVGVGNVLPNVSSVRGALTGVDADGILCRNLTQGTEAVGTIVSGTSIWNCDALTPAPAAGDILQVTIHGRSV